MGINRTVEGGGSHMWRKGEEFNLKHTRFEMTIRHLSGNTESAFESMRVKFRTEV